MPATPNGIFYPAGTDGYDLTVDLAAMATSVDGAIAQRQMHTYMWSNSTERSAQTGMSIGDIGFQYDTGVSYRYSGSAWLWSPQIVEQGLASGSVDGAASPATVITKTFDSYFRPTQVLIQISGQGGFNASTVDVGIDFGLTGGSFVDGGYGQPVQAVAGTFTTVYRAAKITIPGGTVSTLSVKGLSSINGSWWRLMCSYQRIV